MRDLQWLTLGIVDEAIGNGPRISIHIDGESLVERIRRIEFPQASREGAALLAGNYAWPALSLRQLRLLSGEVADSTLPFVLLNCPCGLSDCWPLMLCLRLQPRVVSWESMQQQRRAADWNYDALMPMRFSRANYLAEVDRLRDALKGSKSSPAKSGVRSAAIARSL